MNVLKKMYCRTTQLALRIALPVLPYRKPLVLNNVLDLPKHLLKNEIHTVLLITDASIRKFGITQSLEESCAKEGIACIVYDQTVANPTSENVEEALELYRSNKCQALIGFGGGSAMDCAKAVGARVANPKKSLAQMEGVLKVLHKLPLLIAIPTTSGTGSEVTLASVITDSKTHHKYPINDFVLIPKIAVLDPEVTKTLPAFITACTALDALTHAVEAYIGKSTTKETRADAIEAVHLIFKYLDRAFENGSDMEARTGLSKAAFLAGNAFSKSYVGYVHAVAHSLSGKYNTPHGLTNAVLLPWVLEAYGSCIHKKLANLAVAAGLVENAERPSYATALFIRAIREMNQRFGLPNCIKEIRYEDICELAKTADHEANPLYPVPVLMDAKQLEGFYEKVREGSYERATNPANCVESKNILYKQSNTICAESNLSVAKA